MKNTILSGVSKMIPGVSKVINEVKDAIQTNVNNIVVRKFPFFTNY